MKLFEKGWRLHCAVLCCVEKNREREKKERRKKEERKKESDEERDRERKKEFGQLLWLSW